MTSHVNTKVKRPKGPKNPKTTAFRVTDAELAWVRIAAARRGMTAAAWLRAIVIPAAQKAAA